jgi:hypothetical protein
LALWVNKAYGEDALKVGHVEREALFKNSKKQGDWGMGVAICYFATQGYMVAVPLTDSQLYDLVIDDGSLKRVQVRTTLAQDVYGTYTIDLRVSGGNKSRSTRKHLEKGDFDLLFAVTGSNELFLIPIEAIDSKSHLALGKKMEKFKIAT